MHLKEGGRVAAIRLGWVRYVVLGVYLFWLSQGKRKGVSVRESWTKRGGGEVLFCGLMRIWVIFYMPACE